MALGHACWCQTQFPAPDPPILFWTPDKCIKQHLDTHENAVASESCDIWTLGMGRPLICYRGYDPRRVSGDMHWADVHKPELGYWLLRIRSVTIGGEPLELCQQGDCTAIADTGTSLLGVPKQAAQHIHWLLARDVENNPKDSWWARARAVGQKCTFEIGPNRLSGPDGLRKWLCDKCGQGIPDIKITHTYMKFARRAFSSFGMNPAYHLFSCKAVVFRQYHTLGIAWTHRPVWIRHDPSLYCINKNT